MTETKAGGAQVAAARFKDMGVSESSSDRGERRTAASGERPRAAPPTPFSAAMTQPQQLEKLAPCCAGCASGADVRGWIGVVAQHRNLGLSKEQAYSRAWEIIAAVNPFPATMGRICPHPCESQCSRGDKDGAVAINAMERFLGDRALRERQSLPRLEPVSAPESVGVIGAGPAGLSFAYQMARRGYRVTVYEKEAKPGGMLYYGIPEYRLPGQVLEAEVGRILDLGVELRLETTVGRNISVEEIRRSHGALFLGIGASRGIRLRIPGEDGPGVWTGTEYLSRLNGGKSVDLGGEVVVVGGGNTAVDATRAARRSGARVTMLYRRTRKEMPAIDSEVDDALAEGVDVVFLAAPVEIKRDGPRVRAVVVQRMQLREPDSSGRGSPVPVTGSEYEIPADSVIAAVSQEPDWEGLGMLDPGTVWAKADESGSLGDGLWAGGDVKGAGIAGLAIAQGRQAAEAVHAQLRRLGKREATGAAQVSKRAIKADYYREAKPAVPRKRPAEERLAQPEAQAEETLTEEEFLQEVSRCFSCGSCFGCEHCFTYCNGGGFTRLKEIMPGAYFAFSLDRCESCGKCIELCPCGFLSPR